MKIITENPHPNENTRYSYLIGRIRVMEKGILSNRTVESILRADNLEHTRRILSEITGVGETVQNLEEEPKAIDRALSAFYWNSVREMGSHLAGKEIARFFTLPFDYANAKLVLKRFFASSGKETQEYPGEIPREKLQRFVGGESQEIIPDAMRHGLEEARMEYENTKHPQLPECVLDRYALQEALQMRHVFESVVLRNWIIAYVMFAFIRASLRARFQERSAETLRRLYFENRYIRFEDLEDLASGSEEKAQETIVKMGFTDLVTNEGAFQGDPHALAEMEKVMDDYLMKYIRRYRMSAFGPEPVFGFLYARLTDIRNLRILLLGKYFALAEDDLRAKVRECYHE